jgi:periplasmic divalent cation tolerance protein
MFDTVLVTVPDLETTERIAEVLIEKRLAACANIWPVNSIFRWKDGIERSSEFALTLKIWSTDFPSVVQVVSGLHPYELPCIVKYEISDGSQTFLDWIKGSTERPKADFARR